MASIEIVDRSSLLSGLYEQLVLNPRETALITIDMHRGHLDMDVATMPARPEDAKRVIRNARAALDFARRLEIPVIHVVLVKSSAARAFRMTRFASSGLAGIVA